MWSHDHTASRAGANDVHEKVDAVARLQNSKSKRHLLHDFFLAITIAKHTHHSPTFSSNRAGLHLVFLVKYKSKPIKFGSALKRQFFSEVFVF